MRIGEEMQNSVRFIDIPNFPVSVKILKNCFGDPTTRRKREAVLIDELLVAEMMNGKNE